MSDYDLLLTTKLTALFHTACQVAPPLAFPYALPQIIALRNEIQKLLVIVHPFLESVNARHFHLEAKGNFQALPNSTKADHNIDAQTIRC